MSESIKAQREQLAQIAITNKEILEGLVARLGESSRRVRQNAAAVLSCAASLDAQAVYPYFDEILAAIDRPEAQTRWESLDVMSAFIAIDAQACEKAIDGAEGALFDEDSGPLRLAALRFLCRIGATSPERSAKVWPLVDEAIQCYHGDPEFQDMLVAITAFSESELDPEVAAALRARMEFDSRTGRGILKKRAQQIIANLGEE